MGQFIPKPQAEPEKLRLMKTLGFPQTKEGYRQFEEFGRAPQDTRTSDIKNYEEALKGGFGGSFYDYQAALKKAGAQSSTIKLPPQQNAFEAALGGAQAKKLMEDKTAAEDAVSIIDTVRQGKELLRGPIITGFGAEFLTSVGSALNQAGISFAEDAVANTQAFAGNMAQNVGKLIKLFGAGTGLSDADRAYAEKMAGGKVTLDKAALDKILDINERAARNVIRRHNKNVEAANVTPIIPLGVEMPAEITLPAVRSPSATSTRPATGNLTPDEQRELEALRRRFGRPAQ
jgi:hypothetical protein